jgi:hypothetical protein
MSDEEEGPEDGLMEEWNAHPYTKNFLKAMKMQRDSAVKALLQLSYESTDPAVRAMRGRHFQLEAVIDHIEGKKENA